MNPSRNPLWDLPLDQHEIGRFWIAWAVANGGMTQEQIAQAMGCTNQYVEQIERRALRKLFERHGRRLSESR